MNLENFKNIMVRKFIEDAYINGNLEKVLETTKHKEKGSDEIADIFANITIILEILPTNKFRKSSRDQMKLGTYLQEIGKQLEDYGKNYVEQLEDKKPEEKKTKIEKEIRKDIDEFLDEIFGGK